MQAVAAAVRMPEHKVWAVVAAAVMAQGRLCQPTQLLELQTKAAAVAVVVISMVVMFPQTAEAVS